MAGLQRRSWATPGPGSSTMTIDASAVLAILLGEPEGPLIAQAIASDSRRLIGAVSALEAAIVIQSKKGQAGAQALDLLLYQAGIEVTGMNSQQVELAREAYTNFGKGRHPAALSLGDCCSC